MTNLTSCDVPDLLFCDTIKIVCFSCSFLCLVPDEAKSSYQVEGTGYDTYLRDAHRQVRNKSNKQNKIVNIQYIP